MQGNRTIPTVRDLPADDRERIATALDFYIRKAAWASGDTERAEMERLLAEARGD